MFHVKCYLEIANTHESAETNNEVSLSPNFNEIGGIFGEDLIEENKTYGAIQTERCGISPMIWQYCVSRYTYARKRAQAQQKRNMIYE